MGVGGVLVLVIVLVLVLRVCKIVDVVEVCLTHVLVQVVGLCCSAGGAVVGAGAFFE